MPLLLPIQRIQTSSEAPVTSRFVALFSVEITRPAEANACLLSGDVTRKLETAPSLLAAEIKSGGGTIVYVDAMSSILDAAR